MTWPADASSATRVLAVGECMLELRHRTPLELDLGFAGDTYNTAVYLHRMADNLGVRAEVAYLTGLGEEPYSQQMRAAWAREGVLDASRVVPGHKPGLYAVTTDPRGERSFTYWRAGSAASELFAGTDWVQDLEGDLVHFSGITLQLMSEPSRRAFLGRLAGLRRQGTTVSFDTNFRAGGWSDKELAREVFTQAARVSDIILATLDDEQALAGDSGPHDTAARYRSLEAAEVVVKLGEDGAAVADSTGFHHVPATRVAAVVDTTAAGDSFAGAYLAGRLAGMSPVDSAGLGAEMAARVIQRPGAIIAREGRIRA